MALTERHDTGAPSAQGTGPAELAAEGLAPQPSPVRDIWRRFRKNRLALVGLCVIVVMVIAALFAEVIAPFDPATIEPANARKPPGDGHWLGTDQLGRDLFSRIVFGARVSLRVGIIAVSISTSIGLVAGALAAYYGRWVDALLMRITDIFLAFPYLLAALALITVIGQGERTVWLVLGLLGWMSIARIFRSSVLQVKEMEYIEAARAAGASDFRIITRHILPNAIQPVIVYGTIFVGTAVLSEAALSFLGAGVTEPTPAWGLMVAQGKNFLFSTPHLLFFPSAAIVTTVMAFVFVGDGLRDALDPRLR